MARMDDLLASREYRRRRTGVVPSPVSPPPGDVPYTRDASNVRFPGPDEPRGYLGGPWPGSHEQLNPSRRVAPGSPGTVYEPSTASARRSTSAYTGEAPSRTTRTGPGDRERGDRETPYEGGGGDRGEPGGRGVNPWDRPNASTNAPRIVERNGQTYLTEHGNWRLLQPNEVASAQQYVEDFWRRFPTGFQPGVGVQRNEDYANYGQTVTPGESPVTARGGSHARTTPPPSSSTSSAGRSTERSMAPPAEYGASYGGSTPEDPYGDAGAGTGEPGGSGGGNAGGSTTVPPASTTSAPGTAGTGGGYTYTGFDFAQDAANRDVTKSAKYAFAEATRQAEADGAGDIWKTRAGAQHFATQYVKPFLEAQGYQVLEIVGDKMRIVTREAREAGNTAGVWIDFVVNADGDNPALAWQEEQERSAFGTLDTPYDTSAFGGSAPPATAGTGGDGNRGTDAPTSSPYGVNEAAYEELADPTLYDLTYARFYENQRNR